MPAKRVLMRRIREILRLKHASGATDRAIARSHRHRALPIALYLERAAATGPTWQDLARHNAHEGERPCM